MSETATAQPAAQTPAAATPAAPEKPSVNIEEVVKQVGKELEKSLDKKNKEFADELAGRISGREEKPPVNPYHEALATKPQEFFSELVKTVKSETRAEVLQELKNQEANEKLWKNTMEPIYAEIPDLRKLDFELMGQMSQLAEGEGKDLKFTDLAKKAAEKTAEKLGLKKLSEEERKRAASAAFVPPASGAGPGPAPGYDPDSRESKMKYITQVRETLNANRRWSARKP